MKIIRNYHELIKFPTFFERYDYLKLGGVVGEITFGYERYLNQAFYSSRKWKTIRNEVILRDDGCDLGCSDYPINDRVYVHHLNPITMKMIEEESPYLFDPEFLICVSYRTHNAIHYGDRSLLPDGLIERMPNDTCLWK